MTPETASLPILYSFRRCPYAMRARLAIMVAGLTCQLREVKLSAKPEAMLEASPKGTVPVLVLPDGTVIEESLDVMHHALGVNDPEAWLDRADADLIARCDGPFKRDLDRYKYPDRYDSDATAHRSAGLAFLQDLEARLGEDENLSGSPRGLTDMAIMPFIRQFAATDRTWFDAQPLSRLRAWLDGHLGSDLFKSIMVRHGPWQPDDTPILFAAG